jgi:hypothetical protein
MPLQRGEVQGYDFNRMIVEFTMLNQGKVILCAISLATKRACADLQSARLRAQLPPAGNASIVTDEKCVDYARECVRLVD